MIYKYGDIGREILSSMKCKHCEGKIKYHVEGWGNEVINWQGLHCEDCNKTHGWTGMDSYNIKTKQQMNWCFRIVQIIFH